jgi:hypothetical protein
MAEKEEIEFTPLQDELFTLLDKNDIDDNLWDTCLIAFSTDEALQKAIDWLKEHPDFTNWDITRIIPKFGVESEDFTTHIEIVDGDYEADDKE